MHARIISGIQRRMIEKRDDDDDCRTTEKDVSEREEGNYDGSDERIDIMSKIVLQNNYTHVEGSKNAGTPGTVAIVDQPCSEASGREKYDNNGSHVNNILAFQSHVSAREMSSHGKEETNLNKEILLAEEPNDNVYDSTDHSRDSDAQRIENNRQALNGGSVSSDRSPVRPISGNAIMGRKNLNHDVDPRRDIFRAAQVPSYVPPASDRNITGQDALRNERPNTGSSNERVLFRGGRGRDRTDSGGRHVQRGRVRGRGSDFLRTIQTFRSEGRAVVRDRDIYVPLSLNFQTSRINEGNSNNWNRGRDEAFPRSRSFISIASSRDYYPEKGASTKKTNFAKTETSSDRTIFNPVPGDDDLEKKRKKETNKPKPQIQKILKVDLPSKGKPTGIVIALARLVELEASMDYVYAKHQLLVKRQKQYHQQRKVLEKLPVGIEALVDDLDKLRRVNDLYD